MQNKRFFILFFGFMLWSQCNCTAIDFIFDPQFLCNYCSSWLDISTCVVWRLLFKSPCVYIKYVFKTVHFSFDRKVLSLILQVLQTILQKWAEKKIKLHFLKMSRNPAFLCQMKHYAIRVAKFYVMVLCRCRETLGKEFFVWRVNLFLLWHAMQLNETVCALKFYREVYKVLHT